MTNFGIALMTAALQVTLVALPAVAVIAWAARRSPRAGVSLAIAVLSLCTALSVVAVIPLPHWWAWDTPAEVVANPSPEAEPPAVSAPASETVGWRIPLSRLTALLPATVPPLVEPDVRWNVWTLISGLFLAGLTVEAMRLLVGLWMVAAIRRRSVPVSDPDLIAQMDAMRVEFGVTGLVAIRQSTAVGTAATIGWRRPVILLAADWPTWDSAERRAVLAHELAHVRRRDYLTSLLAAVIRAAHFYHPLVRWLAARLRLHQELAADTLAAAVAGGRAVYSQALARMALRQDAAIGAGMARPFLSDRISLIRRITMLRVTDDNRPLNRPTRWVLVAMLGLTAFAASTVRGPAQAPAAAGPVQTAEVPPFDVSQVPANANLLVAFRPAAVLAMPGMKPLAERFNCYLATELKQIAFPSNMKLTVEEVEQVVITGEGPKVSPPNGGELRPGEVRPGIVFETVLVRVTHDFDWPAVIRAGAAAEKVELHEVRPGLFRVGDNSYFRVADRRTLLFLAPHGLMGGDSVETLLAQTKPAADLVAAWGPAWPKAQRAAALLAFDNRKGIWANVLVGPPPQGPLPPGPNLLTAIGRPSHVVACLDLTEHVTAHVHMTADERVPGQKRANLEALAVWMLAAFRSDSEPRDVITRCLVNNRSITREGTTDSAEFRLIQDGVTIKLADILQAIDWPHAVEEHTP